MQEGIINKQLFFDEHLDDHQPFPTLEHALEVLDPIVGFNIEIKWTMLLKVSYYSSDVSFEICVLPGHASGCVHYQVLTQVSLSTGWNIRT